jgi:ribonuclease VapC
LTALAVDTSAIVAILWNEPEKDRFLDVIMTSGPRFMSAANLQEAEMVIVGRSGDAADLEPLNALLSRLDVEIAAHDASLAQFAREAFVRFGKGRHGEIESRRLRRLRPGQSPQPSFAVQRRGFLENRRPDGDITHPERDRLRPISRNE